MRIFVIRHGESRATLDPSLFSRQDPKTIPLTQWGYEQAVEAGKHLAQCTNPPLRPLRIYYSPHLRIRQSKDGVLQGLAASATVRGTHEDHLLREREHGEFDGLTAEQQQQKNLEVYEKLHSQNSQERYTTKMPGGESIQDVQERLREFLETIKQCASPDEDVVIITHGGNCRAIEENIIHYNASWPCPFENPPGTGDIIELNTDFSSPGTSQIIHQGKKRTTSIPGNYKTEPFDAALGIR